MPNGADQVNEVLTEKDIDDIIKFLKTVVVDDTNIDLIKSKLVASSARRLKMVKVPKTDFLEHFPFFFFRPELVSNSNVNTFHLISDNVHLLF